MDIYFNRPALTGNEKDYVAKSMKGGRIAGDGDYTKKCSTIIEDLSNSYKCLLTHSCTSALEISAILSNLRPGDEVIAPSYTFVSTVNAFVLFGAKVVFIDICEDTQNMDVSLIEQAITPKTKVIIPVHYAGVACEMDQLLDIARRYNLLVVEDAAQGIMSYYNGRMLGSIGDIGTYSFHETKNIISGEGGALLINNETFCERAEIVREKGTDRSKFFRGQVDKYTWQDVGSSYLPGELIAAFLFAQLERAKEITQDRVESWNRYYRMSSLLEEKGDVRRPIVPKYCQHNGHMFYLILNEGIDRGKVLNRMREKGVQATFHYVPLHSAPAGLKYGRLGSGMEKTERTAKSLIRLPLYFGLSNEDQDRIVSCLQESL